jgi:tetratricopeptide (TPR) repeat protein
MRPSFIPLSLWKATAVLVACLGVVCGTRAQAQVCTPPAGVTDSESARSDCLLSAARTAYRERRYADSLSILDQLDSVTRSTPASDVRISAGLVRAQSLFQIGRIDEMHSVATSTWRDAAETRGANSPSALEAQNLVAVALRNKGRTKEAIAVFVDLVARRERVDGREATETIRAKNNLAAALRDAGELALADSLFHDVFTARAKSLGPNHEQSVFAWHNLMAVRWERFGSDAVLREVESALPAQQAVLGRENPEISRMKTLLASMLWAQGRLEETRVLFGEVFLILRKLFGNANGQTQEAARNLALTTLGLGDVEGALEIIESARRDAGGSSDASAMQLRQQLAYIRLLRGDARVALELVSTEVPAADASLKARTPSELAVAFIRAAALSALGRHDEAIAIQERVLESRPRDDPYRGRKG